MTREQYIIKYGRQGLMLGIIPHIKMDRYHRYQVYKKHIAAGRNNMEALFLVSEECCCEYITAYKSVSFFVNLRTKQLK